MAKRLTPQEARLRRRNERHWGVSRKQFRGTDLDKDGEHILAEEVRHHRESEAVKTPGYHALNIANVMLLSPHEEIQYGSTIDINRAFPGVSNLKKGDLVLLIGLANLAKTAPNLSSIEGIVTHTKGKNGQIAYTRVYLQPVTETNNSRGYKI